MPHSGPSNEQEGGSTWQKRLRVQDELARKGIIVNSAGRETLAEEAPEAYKDVSMVVDTAHETGISRKVARMRPLGVIKG